MSCLRYDEEVKFIIFSQKTIRRGGIHFNEESSRIYPGAKNFFYQTEDTVWMMFCLRVVRFIFAGPAV